MIKLSDLNEGICKDVGYIIEEPEWKLKHFWCKKAWLKSTENELMYGSISIPYRSSCLAAESCRSINSRENKQNSTNRSFHLVYYVAEQ